MKQKTNLFRTIFPCLLLVCLFLTACGNNRGGSIPLTTLPPASTGKEVPVLPAEPSPDRTDSPSNMTASPSETTASPAEPSSVPDTSASPDPATVSITWEILRKARTGASGQELVFAQYPVFTVAGQDFPALSRTLSDINEQCLTQCITFLDDAEESARQYQADIDPAYTFSQTISVSLTRCDEEIVCLVIGRTTDEGGPHPNNHSITFNLDTRTGESLKLSDIIPVDETLKDTIKTLLCESYPELDFDASLLEQDLSDALAGNTVVWYFWEDQICISFPEGSFGFGHAEGSLGVLLPWQ